MPVLMDRRIGLLFICFVALLGIGVTKALWLGGVRAGSLRQRANTQQVANVVVPAPRGTITDRHGSDLAVSEPASDIAANPRLIKNPQRLADRLAPILGVQANTLLRDLVKPGTGFVYLKRQLPAGRASRVEKLHVEGLSSVPSSVRNYPQSWLASQLLGTVGIDGRGLSGLENVDDGLLRGHDGERRLVNDALGQPIAIRDRKTARPGKDLTLTIDASIQEKAEEVLAGVGRTYTPKGATAIVMDPNTSEILALANWPRVDANDVAGAPAYARQNRAVAAAYEPGSTFKAFTVAGALEERLVTPSTRFDLAPQIQVADRSIHDAEDRGPVNYSTAEVLSKSSNVGAITIGLRLGKVQFSRWVSRFGFGRPTGVDLPGEERGIVPPVEKYSGSSMGNLPIGQGLAVTPMQMATAYSAIANGGLLRPARVVRAVDGRPVRPYRARRVITNSTAAQIRTMLEGVVAAGGTASEVSIPGYKLAGKTGTANKPDPATGGYSETKYVSSFVGFAPANRPKLLVCVMVDEPQGEIYGGTVAAPAFQKIAAYALPYLRIAPN